MEKVPLCVVGCGGMGHRHIMAYKVLEESGIGNVELMAVCDVRRENAGFAAREVQRLLGREPLVFTDMDSVLKRDDILAVDIVTDVSMHHQVGRCRPSWLASMRWWKSPSALPCAPARP